MKFSSVDSVKFPKFIIAKNGNKTFTSLIFKCGMSIRTERLIFPWRREPKKMFRQNWWAIRDFSINGTSRSDNRTFCTVYEDALREHFVPLFPLYTRYYVGCSRVSIAKIVFFAVIRLKHSHATYSCVITRCYSARASVSVIRSL